MIALASIPSALARRVLTAEANGEAHKEQYRYYPEQWREPYLSRKRKVGYDMYALLGIESSDLDARHAQHNRNFAFFDAPVGLILTVDADLPSGTWIDCGMFLQTLMLLAKAHGLDTCPQQSFVKFHAVVRACLGLDKTSIILCGMSLGYADTSAPVNRLRTEREPVESFATIHLK